MCSFGRVFLAVCTDIYASPSTTTKPSLVVILHANLFVFSLADNLSISRYNPSDVESFINTSIDSLNIVLDH